MRMNTERVPKSCSANADPASTRKAAIAQEEGEASTARVRRGFGDGMFAEGVLWQRGKSRAVDRRMPDQPEAREGKTGLAGWRRGPYYPGSRATPVEGTGLGSRVGRNKQREKRAIDFIVSTIKIHRKELLHAWDRFRANGGAAGSLFRAGHRNLLSVFASYGKLRSAIATRCESLESSIR